MKELRKKRRGGGAEVKARKNVTGSDRVKKSKLETWTKEIGKMKYAVSKISLTQ